jgi:hypothetical protein
MKFLRVVAVLLCSLAAAHAAGPIRVLYLGQDDPLPRQHCAYLMQQLGRDAIWFDYAPAAASSSPEKHANFDAVLLDSPTATAFFPPDVSVLSP